MMSSSKRSTLISALLHIVVVAVVVILSSMPQAPAPAPAPRTTLLVPTDLRDYLPKVPRTANAGGGGGKHDLTPASPGRLPRIAPRQFTPPAVVVRNTNPILAIEPTIVASATTVLPVIDLPQFGDPHGTGKTPSDGTGRGGGIGDGDGTGVGPGKGPGAGPGDTPGVSGYGKVQGVVVNPVVLSQIEPEYSEDARRARLQGTVVLRIDIGVDGRAHNISIAQSLGLGLDERAIDAVKLWRFRAGTVDGKPVVMSAQVQVNFRLL